MSKAKKPVKKTAAKAAPKKVVKTEKKVLAKAKPKTVKKAAAPKKVEKTNKKPIAKPVAKTKTKVEVKAKDNKDKKQAGKKESIISKVAAKVAKEVKEVVKKATTPAAKEKEVKLSKKDQAKLDKELKAKAKEDTKAKKKKASMDDEDDLDHEELDGEEEDDFFEEEKASKKSKKMELEDDEDFSEEALYKESLKIPSGRAKEIVELEDKIHTEISVLREHFNWKDIADSIATLDFFVNQRTDECSEKGCDNLKTTQNYCRLHYVTNWYSIQKKREILKEGKLQEYIEELISKYPPKYIQAIVSDLSDDKEFYKALTELNISSDFDFEEEEFDADDDADDGDDEIIEARYTGGGVRYEDDN